MTSSCIFVLYCFPQALFPDIYRLLVQERDREQTTVDQKIFVVKIIRILKFLMYFITQRFRNVAHTRILIFVTPVDWLNDENFQIYGSLLTL